MSWSLQDARNQISELASVPALRDRRKSRENGQEAVVIVSAEEMGGIRKQSSTLADFLLSSPLAGSGLEVERDVSPLRRVNL